MTDSLEGKNPREEQQSKAKPIKAPAVRPETYHCVKFSAASTPNDTENVILAVNGETLIIQREREVVIPRRFLECADHAMIQRFEQVPGRERKQLAPIKLYPYTYLRAATQREYEQSKAAGTKKTRRNVDRYGFDANPITEEDDFDAPQGIDQLAATAGQG